MDRCLLKDILLEPKVQMQTLPSVQPSLYHTSYANEEVQEIQYYIHLTRELHIKMILFHKLFYIFTYDAQVRNGYARDTWLWQGHGFYAKVKDTIQHDTSPKVSMQHGYVHINSSTNSQSRDK